MEGGRISRRLGLPKTAALRNENLGEKTQWKTKSKVQWALQNSAQGGGSCQQARVARGVQNSPSISCFRVKDGQPAPINNRSIYHVVTEEQELQMWPEEVLEARQNEQGEWELGSIIEVTALAIMRKQRELGRIIEVTAIVIMRKQQGSSSKNPASISPIPPRGQGQSWREGGYW